MLTDERPSLPSLPLGLPPPPCRVVAIVGWAGAGKDTFAHDLLQHLPVSRPYAFADPLRVAAAAAYGINPAAFVCRTAKEAQVGPPQRPGLTPRGALRQLGQALRQGDPWHWVRQAAAWATAHCGPGATLVVTDVRQPNELAWCLAAPGSTAVAVYRPGVVGGSHETELLPLWPALAAHVVVNSMGLAELAGMAPLVAQGVLTRPNGPNAAPGYVYTPGAAHLEVGGTLAHVARLCGAEPGVWLAWRQALAAALWGAEKVAQPG